MRIYKILQAGKYHDDNFREALFRRRRSIWARSQVPADITEKNPEIYQLIFDHFQNDLMTFINLIINIWISKMFEDDFSDDDLSKKKVEKIILNFKKALYNSRG